MKRNGRIITLLLELAALTITSLLCFTLLSAEAAGNAANALTGIAILAVGLATTLTLNGWILDKCK